MTSGEGRIVPLRYKYGDSRARFDFNYSAIAHVSAHDHSHQYTCTNTHTHTHNGSCRHVKPLTQSSRHLQHCIRARKRTLTRTHTCINADGPHTLCCHSPQAPSPSRPHTRTRTQSRRAADTRTRSARLVLLLVTVPMVASVV